MSAHPAEVRKLPVLRVGVLVACLLLIGLAVAWIYFPMRDVLSIGGSCASGGPYVIATPCPQSATVFLTVAVPLWFASAFVGMFAAATLTAPNPIMPGWALLFGALGWNFMDFAFRADPSGRVEVSWLVCGIMFWLMALPAVVIFIGGRLLRRQLLDAPGSGLTWTGVYLVLLAVGWWLGTTSLHAWT